MFWLAFVCVFLFVVLFVAYVLMTYKGWPPVNGIVRVLNTATSLTTGVLFLPLSQLLLHTFRCHDMTSDGVVRSEWVIMG